MTNRPEFIELKVNRLKVRWIGIGSILRKLSILAIIALTNGVQWYWRPKPETVYIRADGPKRVDLIPLTTFRKSSVPSIGTDSDAPRTPFDEE